MGHWDSEKSTAGFCEKHLLKFVSRYFSDLILTFILGALFSNLCDSKPFIKMKQEERYIAVKYLKLYFVNILHWKYVFIHQMTKLFRDTRKSTGPRNFNNIRLIRKEKKLDPSARNLPSWLSLL